ncbi:MAG: hypothetical protein ACE5GO_04855 [Anaerolineales bacterium]
MNAPVLWIVAPLLAAILLFLFRYWERPVTVTGAIFALVLAWLAWVIPVEEALSIGPWSLKLNDALAVLGRRFVIADTDRGIISLIYLITALWFGGALFAKPGHLFVPLGLGIVGLLIAALAVEPFLFAALFIELAVLFSVPILVPPGKTAGQGVLRFLSFQTLGTPFILFAGWMLGGLNTDALGSEAIISPVVVMGFGFALLLAVFPFHTWLPMMAEETHPYLAGFIFMILPGIISLFGLGFFDRYAWLRDSTTVYGMLRAVGFLMALTGGVWAAFEKHLGRMLGFAAIVENGMSLLTLGLGGENSLEIFFALLPPRALGYAIWALALSEIHARCGSAMRFRDLDFSGLEKLGIGRRLPFTVGGLVLAHLSVAGFPLLAGFPSRLALWESLATQYPVAAFGALLGSGGVLVGALRTLSVAVMAPEGEGETGEAGQHSPVTEPRSRKIFFSLAGFLLLLFGVFPHWFGPLLARLPQAFEQMIP